MPLCFGRSGSVRARHTPQCALCAADVHTFWPGELPTAFGPNGFRPQRRQIRPGAGLAEQLAPDELAAQRRRARTRSTCSGCRARGSSAPPTSRSPGRDGRRRRPPTPDRSAAARPATASRPYGRGQCGASSPVSASAIWRFSSGSAATSATAAAISGCRCSTDARSMCRSRRDALLRQRRDPAQPVRRAAEELRQCRTPAADTGARRAPR